MSFSSGSSGGMSVGSVTAQYKIDATQAMNTIGQIMISADQVKTTFGNVKMTLDTSQYVSEMRNAINMNAEYKQSLAAAASALADKRAAELQNVSVVGQRRTAEAAAAQVTLQRKQADADAAKAANDLALATKQQSLSAAEARTAMANYNTSSAQMRNEMVAARQAAMEEAAAVRDSGSAHQSLTSLLGQSALAGAAFRAGEMLITSAVRDTISAFQDSIGAAVSWEQTLIQVQSNTTMTSGDVTQMDTAIKGMAAHTPADMDKLAQGFRIASSEGYSIADSQKIAEAAMKSSVSTGSDLQATINELATVMHIFHTSTDDSTKSMDILHQASVLGKTDLQEFVTGTQRAYATAANYGVSLKDASAALADFTRNGYTASQSSTQLIGLITHIADPSVAARTELEKLSKLTGIDLVSDFSHAGLASKGLDGVLADLQAVIQKTGDESIISHLVPALRGAQGGYVLLGNGAQDYANIQANLNQIMTGQTSPTMEAYNRTMNTAAFQIGVLKNDFHLFALEIGNYLLPYLKLAVEWMSSLLTAMGVDLKVPGMDQAKTAVDGVTTSTQQATESQKNLNTAANEDKSQALQAANDQITQFSQQALDAAANVRQLTDTANDLKAQMDQVNEDMKGVQDKYSALINPLESQVRSIENVTPEEFNRHMTELGIQQQEVQLKLNAPDTSAYTETINNLKGQIDNLGEAQTGAVDARIEALQDKLKALGKVATVGIDQQINDLRIQMDAIGNTKGLDRQIQDLQSQLNKPAQSTNVQEAGMAALTAQLGSGSITQAQFDAQYQTLGKQRQAIIENNTVQKTAIQQEISDLEDKRTLQQRTDEDAKAALDSRIKDLERQKQTIIDNNTAAKAGIQDQIDQATEQKKQITDTFNATKKGLEDQVKAQELAKSNATAEYDQKMATLTKQMDYNKLLDEQSQVTKDIAEYPLKQQIDAYKQAETDLLGPLQKHKDDLQAVVDKNNEALASARAQEAQYKANEEAAKALVKTLGDPTLNPNAGEGPENPPGGPVPAPTGVGNDPGLPGHREDSLAQAANAAGPAWFQNLKNALETGETDIAGIMLRIKGDFQDVLQWGEDNHQGILDFLGNSWQEAVNLANLALDALEAAVKGGSGIIELAIALEQHDWGQAWQDLQDITSTGKTKTGALYDEFGNKLGNSTTTTLTDLKTQHKTYQDNLLGDYQKWWDQYMFHTDTGHSAFDTSTDKWLKKWFGYTFGANGDWGQAFSNAGTFANSIMGEGGMVGGAFDWLGTHIGGPVKGYVDFAFGADGYWGKAFSDAGTTANGFFGEGGTVGKMFGQFGTWLHNFFGDSGPMASAFSGFGGIIRGALNSTMVEVLNKGLSVVGSFVNGIIGGINSLASNLHVSLTLDKWTVPQIDATALATGTDAWGGGVALVGEAGRELGIIDGIPHLFDQPTVVNLPPGSIIKPNDETERILNNTASGASNLGASASDLASGLMHGVGTGNYGLEGVGGVLDSLGALKDKALSGVRALSGAARDAVSGIIGKGMGAAIDAILSAVGVPDMQFGGVNIGPGLVSTVKDLLTTGLKDMWDSVSGALPPAGGPRGGGGIAGGGDLVAAIKAATSNGAEQQAMLFGAFLETGGQNIAQIGGGPGAGYFQIEAGPGGQYAGQVDPYDPVAAARFMEPQYRAAMGAYDANNLENSLAEVAYNAERPADRYSGEKIATAWDLIQPFLVSGGIAPFIGPTTPGGNSAVVDQAARFIGAVSSDGLTDDGLWSGWCERFVEFMNEYAGTGLVSGSFGSAAIHMRHSMTNTDDNPPPGASVYFFGPGWGGDYGHVGIAVGDGTVISTTGLIGSGTPVRQSDGWIGSPGYQGWSPPGMKNGGVFTVPTIITTGDIPGRVPEVTAPQPMIKQSVKDAISEMAGGVGGGSVIFQAGSIVQAPGEDAEALATRVANKIRANMQRGGKNGI